MNKIRKRWFGHVMKRQETNAVIMVMKMNVGGKIGRKRPKRGWLDTIENMRAANVCVGDKKDRTNGGLGQGCSTSNSLEEGREEKSYIIQVRYESHRNKLYTLF